MANLPLWAIVEGLPETAFQGKNRIVFDFILQGVSEEEANFFGMTWENSIAIEPHWTMAHIIKEVGLFPSVGQAKKNGWDKPIEHGFSEFGPLGKKKFCIFILNPIGSELPFLTAL